MSRDRKKKDNDSEINDDWMTTYGDMMTLLLAFFVLLFSMANIDEEKFDMVIHGLQGRLGVIDGGRTISRRDAVDMGLEMSDLAAMQLEELERRIGEYIETEGLDDDIILEVDDEGLTIHFTGEILFELGRAEIRPEAREILDRISGFIKTIPNDIMVEGHTDNWPIRTERFPSNWELSTARATNVVRHLIEELDVAPDRLSAAGYSEYRPLRPNDTAENRALNRRVDIVILRLDEDQITASELDDEEMDSPETEDLIEPEIEE